MTEIHERVEFYLKKNTPLWQIRLILNIEKLTLKNLMEDLVKFNDEQIRIENETICENRKIFKDIEERLWAKALQLQKDSRNKTLLSEFKELQELYSEKTLYDKINYNADEKTIGEVP